MHGSRASSRWSASNDLSCSKSNCSARLSIRGARRGPCSRRSLSSTGRIGASRGTSLSKQAASSSARRSGSRSSSKPCCVLQQTRRCDVGRRHNVGEPTDCQLPKLLSDKQATEAGFDVLTILERSEGRADEGTQET